MVIALIGAGYAGYKYGKSAVRKARAYRKCRKKRGASRRACIRKAMK